jgi:hypothetical protein
MGRGGAEGGLAIPPNPCSKCTHLLAGPPDATSGGPGFFMENREGMLSGLVDHGRLSGEVFKDRRVNLSHPLIQIPLIQIGSAVLIQ